MAKPLTKDDKVRLLKEKYDPSYAPELDAIVPKREPPEMEKPAKKISRKPHREKPVPKRKPPKIFFKNGIAHDVDTGKPL